MDDQLPDAIAAAAARGIDAVRDIVTTTADAERYDPAVPAAVRAAGLHLLPVPSDRGGLGANLQAVATRGRIVVIGIGAGAKGELDLRALMTKRATLRASTLRARPLEEKALTARAMERHVLPLFDSGALRVPLAETFPLERAVEAYDRFAEGGKIGKIVLVTDGG